MALMFVGATLKIVVGLVSWLWIPGDRPLPPSALPSWYYVGLLVVFGASGIVLYLGGKGDVRTLSLGLVFLLFGSLFADRLLARAMTSLPEGLARGAAIVADVHLTALHPFALWRFAWWFPLVQSALVPSWVPRWMVRLTLGAGIVLTAGTLVIRALGDADSSLAMLGAWLSPNTENGWFWPVCAVLSVPSLALLVAKWSAANASDQRRLGWVVGGLVIGSFPMVVHVLLVTAVPAYAAFASEPEHNRALGILLSAFSLVIPASAAYAALVVQVLEVRFLIHRAVQYALARYTVVGLMVGLVVGLAAVAYRNRDRPLGELLGDSPLSAVALGLLAMVFLWRRPLLEAIDRRFFREQYDARRILVELVDKSQKAQTARDLMTLITGEVDRALHLERISLLVRDDDGAHLLDPEGRLRDLSMDGALGALVGGSPAPLDVDLSWGSSPLGRLPEADREWLADAGARLIVPLLGAQGGPLGVLALGEKRSGLPFTAEDRQLMTAVAASAALALEQKLHRESPNPDPARTARGQPARQCVTCGRVQDRGNAACHACGSALRDALLPAVLAGKFEIERQIGAGGMGVVYRAQDLALHRTVAIKVLPRVAPEATARLRREAHAMAAMQHHNLAVIHAMESWRGSPVLVLEYLAGGTVGDRIRGGPFPVGDVVGLGVVVADVLHYVHRAGYLHRDIKPSNIGYTEGGVAKLLDFGLVRLVTALSAVSSATNTDASESESIEEGMVGLSTATTAPAFETAAQRIVGTPAYLSPEAVALESPTQGLDLWGLAVTLYEALTRKNPFLAGTIAETVRLVAKAVVPDPRELRPDCPADLAAFLTTALALDPHRRPQSALDFKSRLQAAASEGDLRVH